MDVHVYYVCSWAGWYRAEGWLFGLHVSWVHLFPEPLTPCGFLVNQFLDCLTSAEVKQA